MLVRCPHCKQPATIRTSRELAATVRELQMQCQNLECAHTWVAYIEAIRTIAPSMTPDPQVYLPLSPRSMAAMPPPDAQLGLPLDGPAHPRALSPPWPPNTS